MMRLGGGLAAFVWLLAAGAAADCFYDLAATRNYELGFPAKAVPTSDGKAVVYLRAGGPRDSTQHLYLYDLIRHIERELITPAALLKGADETMSAEEKSRRERARITARGFTDFQLTSDGRQVLLGLSGRLYLVDRTTGAVRPVAGTGWTAPRISPDGRKLAAVRDNDLSVIDLISGQITALTKAAPEDVTRGAADFIAAEELNRQEGSWWSPDSRLVAFEESDNSDLEPHFIANPGNPAQPPARFRYPRTGTSNARLRLGITPADGGKVVWAAWDNQAFPYLARVVWPKGGPLTILVMNRDQTEEKLLTVDEASGETQLLLSEQDPAWLNLPSQGAGRNAGPLPYWLEDGSGFLWESERGGQWQLELRRKDGSLDHSVTPAGFRLTGVIDVDLGRGDVVVEGGPDRLSNALYRFPLAGGLPTPLAGERGFNSAEFGEGHDIFVHSYSLADGRRGVALRKRDGQRLADLPTTAEAPPALPAVNWTSVGPQQLDAQIVRPHDFKPGQPYPVLLSVYAGPTLKNVTAVARRALQQQCMADRGFIVVTIDNRGTPGRDRAFERVIKGNLIDIALSDQIEGLQALAAETPEMDLHHVGVYGWSFGGYFSAMATLRRPDVFAAGIAGAPVVDWQDYDTAYTERYLGQPSANEAGYRQSNVLTYAADLVRPLMLIHGLTDDNVYFQHSVKLTQALLAAGKDYELVMLPGTHQLADPTLRARLDQRESDFFARALRPAP